MVENSTQAYRGGSFPKVVQEANTEDEESE